MIYDEGESTKKQEAAMSMYFYDETDDWPEYQIIKDDIHRLEKEQLEIRTQLHKIESSFATHPENKGLKAKLDALKNKLKEVENRLEKSSNLFR
jgi:capsule polysaccharide export protein KpsE/RkpR